MRSITEKLKLNEFSNRFFFYWMIWAFSRLEKSPILWFFIVIKIFCISFDDIFVFCTGFLIREVINKADGLLKSIIQDDNYREKIT
jgi:hypothetical protein